MSISSQQLWPHIRDAFGISPDLKVTEFELKLSLDQAAQITMEMFADYDPASEELKTITSKFNLGEKGIPKEHAEQSYWQGFNQGFQAGRDPSWMHAAHLIAMTARKEIQDMANAFNNRLHGKPEQILHG